MPLPNEYLSYARRRHGMDHDRYPWSNLFERKPVKWPNDAKIALLVAPVLEFFPLNPPKLPFMAPGSMVTPYPDLRHYTSRDYGNRVGFFRFLKLFDRLGVKATVAMNAAVAERYPLLVRECTRRNFEIMAHGVDMGRLHYGGLDETVEAEQIKSCLETLRRLSGQKVRGWMSPARSESWATPDLVKAEGIDYLCDWVNDDMPYAFATRNGQLHTMPLGTELSDRQILIDYHASEAAYVEAVKDQFDHLWREADKFGGRILALTVTPYITGLPYRIKALEEALRYVLDHSGVWVATGSEILDAYRAQLA